jgi:phage shock protein A
MAAGDPNADPRKAISEGIRQIRESLAKIREDSVAIVAHRNQLMAELDGLNNQAADYDEKARLARSIGREDLAADISSGAAELRQQAKSVELQLAQVQEKAAQSIENSRTFEATASARLAALQEKVLAAVSGEGANSQAQQDWDRATAKIAALTQQAQANAPQEGQTQLQQAAVERTVEQMLSDLERRAVQRPVQEPASDVSAQPPPRELAAPALILRKEDFRMDPKRRVKVAAIGTGGIFRGAHLPAHVELPQVQLVAFVDPDKTAQDLVHKRYRQLIEAKVAVAREKGDHDEVARLESDFENIRIFEDIQQVIEMTEDRPELLDVCTQPVLHAPLSIQGLEAGFHVMCEKPISRSWLESQRVIEAVKRTGQFYQHNENWLFDPAITPLKSSWMRAKLAN